MLLIARIVTIKNKKFQKLKVGIDVYSYLVEIFFGDFKT
jgi:hypothetical protein